MNPVMTALRDQVVALELFEAHHGTADPTGPVGWAALDADGYRTAARSVRSIIERHLTEVPMQRFASETVPTLQTIAENVFFDRHGRLPDAGSGPGDASRCTAGSAKSIADRLLRVLVRS